MFDYGKWIMLQLNTDLQQARPQGGGGPQWGRFYKQNLRIYARTFFNAANMYTYKS